MTTNGASNFCPESLEARRKDLAACKTLVFGQMCEAIAHAEQADMGAAHLALDEALRRLASMRPDLDDLAMEIERKLDAGL